MKKILIINPPNQPFSEKSLLIEPIDLLSVATYISSLGYEVKTVDMDVKRIKPEGIEFILSNFNPEFTIIPFDYHVPLHRSESIPGINKIAQLAKQKGSTTIISGKTPKHYPLIFLKNGFDIVINGPMEFILEELIISGKKLKSLSEIKGISYLNNEKLVKNPDINNCNFDMMPIPNRRLVDIDDYIDVRAIWSSRGCNWMCNFCATSDFWGSWNARNSVKVADEIEMLVKDYKARKIIFLDDDATFDKIRMKDISNYLIKRKINVNLGCLSRVTDYNLESISLMEKACFRWIHYGCESGSEKILSSVKKGLNPDLIREAIIGTKNAGLRVRTSWIYDLPGTDKQAIKDTNKLILETEPEEIRIHYLSPRVGTKFHNPNNSLQSQYIHHDSPQGTVNCDLSEIYSGIANLTEELRKRGYLIIQDMTEWEQVSKLKNPRFISFCPSRYGLGWEKE